MNYYVCFSKSVIQFCWYHWVQKMLWSPNSAACKARTKLLNRTRLNNQVNLEERASQHPLILMCLHSLSPLELTILSIIDGRFSWIHVCCGFCRLRKLLISVLMNARLIDSSESQIYLIHTNNYHITCFKISANSK